MSQNNNIQTTTKAIKCDNKEGSYDSSCGYPLLQSCPYKDTLTDVMETATNNRLVALLVSEPNPKDIVVPNFYVLTNTVWDCCSSLPCLWYPQGLCSLIALGSIGVPLGERSLRLHNKQAICLHDNLPKLDSYKTVTGTRVSFLSFQVMGLQPGTAHCMFPPPFCAISVVEVLVLSPLSLTNEG